MLNNLNIYYTRHCNTVHNLLKELKFLNKSYFKNIDVENPALSNFGINHALHIYNHSNFNKHFHPEIVCASYYVRSWMSAFILYNDYFKKNNKLYIVPYIHEYHDNVKASSIEKADEIKKFNCKVSILKFKKFINYLKKFMKLYYPKLYKQFTFKIPKLSFVNKYGNIVKEKDVYNLDYYIKNMYIYNPNLHIFEKKILKKFLEKTKNNHIQNISIITHGKFIKYDLLSFKNKKKMYEYIERKKINIFRKFVENNIELNNCDTYLKNNEKVSQIFPPKNKLNDFDYYRVPFYKTKFANKRIVEQLLKNNKINLNIKDASYIFGFYNKKNKKKLFYIKKLIDLYIQFLRNKNNQSHMEQIKNIKNN
jgi:hypothetical protein